LARPKGGVIKSINAAGDTVAIRNSLDVSGALPVLSEAAVRLIRWRQLIAQRDNCAKLIAAKAKGQTVTKWTRKQLKTMLRQHKQLVNDKWCELGVELGGLSNEQFQAVLSQALEQHLRHLRLSSQPPVFGWQAEATRLLELAYLNGEEDKPTSLKGATVNMTARQLAEHLGAIGYSIFTQSGSDSADKARLSALHNLRRFVRDTLQVTLRDERGKRNNLRRKK
jgi:hypothetical protein